VASLLCLLWRMTDEQADDIRIALNKKHEEIK